MSYLSKYFTPEFEKNLDKRAKEKREAEEEGGRQGYEIMKKEFGEDFLSKPKKRGRPRKEQNILKARSDIKKSDSSKSGYVVDTQMNVIDNLTPKVKKALKLSLQQAIKQHIGV
jgi:hypothetical protein